MATRCSWPRALLAALAITLTACPRGDDPPPAATPAVSLDTQRFTVELFGDDLALGGEHPLVTVVVFTDYACPPCGKTWDVMDNLVEDYGPDLRVVFRSYTVPGFSRGERAVEAALCAHEQGKFWEMHRRLFASAPAFDRPSMRAHAEAVGLDTDAFMEALDTGASAGIRIRHRRQAKRLGIVGLPAMFINGRFMTGYADEATWHAMIDDEIGRVRELLASGVKRSEIYAALMKDASSRRVPTPEAGALEQDLERKQAQVDPSTARVIAPSPKKRYRIEPGPSPALGPDDAPVVVVAFLDYQCPYCRRAWKEELRALVDTKKKSVKFAVRHLPLAIHPSAKGIAVAALAAGRQGKFWEFHQAMLDYEGEVGRDVFLATAKTLGMDDAKFVADLDDEALAQQVKDDMRLAVKVGVMGTPGFFVNGRYARGYNPREVATLIDEEMEAAKVTMATGVARGEVFPEIMAQAVQPEEFPNQ
jgi:protein-disulfide isomerase